MSKKTEPTMAEVWGLPLEAEKQPVRLDEPDLDMWLVRTIRGHLIATDLERNEAEAITRAVNEHDEAMDLLRSAADLIDSIEGKTADYIRGFLKEEDDART